MRPYQRRATRARTWFICADGPCSFAGAMTQQRHVVTYTQTNVGEMLPPKCATDWAVRNSPSALHLSSKKSCERFLLLLCAFTFVGGLEVPCSGFVWKYLNMLSNIPSFSLIAVQHGGLCDHEVSYVYFAIHVWLVWKPLCFPSCRFDLLSV